MLCIRDSPFLTVRSGISNTIDHSSPHVRSTACTDSLIVVYGVTFYVQQVLLPETAILLNKKDRSVHDAKARSILDEAWRFESRHLYEVKVEVNHVCQLRNFNVQYSGTGGAPEQK